jgi:hypothetical protein
MQQLLRSYRPKREAEAATGSRRNRNRIAVASVPESQRLPAAVARYLSQYDREHFYKEVWSAPMPKLPNTTGDELEIEKAFRHLHISIPPQGYWAQNGAGLQPSTAPPLPTLPTSTPDHRTDSQS